MPKSSVINDYLAGGVGGCAGIVVGHPLDTVKVQLQTQEVGGALSGLKECIQTIQRHTLAEGYFRGLSWPLISYGYLNAVFFGSYGVALKFMDYEETTVQRPHYATIGLAAFVATFPQLVFSCPVEVIKVVLQSQISHAKGVNSIVEKEFYKGPFAACTSIIKSSGMKGLYRGFGVQVVRDSPASVVYLVAYTFFQYESKHRIPVIPSQVVNFIGGGLAGVLSWMCIMPFDVVKSKLQADPDRRLYAGVWDCVRQVYASKGIRAFFQGLIPMVIRAFPVNAITLMVYSESLAYLER